MPRKIVLDVDPGIADAVAMALALFDPRWEVVATTAVGGNVSAEQATRNVQAILERLDPQRWPRVGAAAEPERAPDVHRRHLNGEDGLGNAQFPVAELHHVHASEKVLYDIIRAFPEEVTILALGPLTNLARLLRRDPHIAADIGQMVILGGTLCGPGDVTPAAEFNIYCDPLAARTVFYSRTTKTLVPLDITRQVTFSLDLLNHLPDESSRIGRFLRTVTPHAFRAYRHELGMEEILLPEAVALVAALRPELFSLRSMSGDVETAGEITTGATVFDRRGAWPEKPTVHVVTDVDAAAVRETVLRGLRELAVPDRR